MWHESLISKMDRQSHVTKQKMKLHNPVCMSKNWWMNNNNYIAINNKTGGNI